MTTINLALRNLYGYVVHGDSLRLEKRLVYKTGFNLRGFVREIPIEDCPAPVQQVAVETPQKKETADGETVEIDDIPNQQLKLF